MDLFGDKLKEIRLEKKLSMDQVARDTKISKKYLDAIEDNDFSVFPSETYLIGFLRSYTEYLGLDSSKYITQYKNYKIQEQPIPINELLDNKKKIHPVLVVFLVVVGIGVISAVSILGYNYYQTNKSGMDIPLKPKPEEVTYNRKYYFKDEINTEWFSNNDQIIFPIGENEYSIVITKVAEDNNSVKLKINNKTNIEIKKEKEAAFSVNNDDNADIRIVLNTIEEKEGRKQAFLGLYKITTMVASTIAGADEDTTSDTSVASQVEITNVSNSVPINAESAANVSLIYESQNTEPFVINLLFKGECLFRYVIDNKERYQKFFQKDEKKEDINVSKNIKLWLSNAGSVKARIAGKEIILGRAGQVVTKLIQWKRDTETNKYKLEISSIY